jgi:hypothetical protein
MTTAFISLYTLLLIQLHTHLNDVSKATCLHGYKMCKNAFLLMSIYKLYLMFTRYSYKKVLNIGEKKIKHPYRPIYFWSVSWTNQITYNIRIKIYFCSCYVFINLISTLFNFRVEPGQYAIVPSCFDSGKEKEFLVKVYTPAPIYNVRYKYFLIKWKVYTSIWVTNKNNILL